MVPDDSYSKGRPVSTRPNLFDRLGLIFRGIGEAPAPSMPDPAAEAKVTVDRFHLLYYGSDTRTWRQTYWMGVRTAKCPLDMWIYQEIMWEIKPDWIIETGTFDGGSALFMACICDLIGCGRIITVDIEERPNRPTHPRVEYVTGSSIESGIVEKIGKACHGSSSVLVILDSDHRMSHVIEEMRAYGPMVTPGSYLIVEDTNVNGHPIEPSFGPGPMEAVEQFLKERSDFVTDLDREKFFFTFNPMGYLRKQASG